MFTDFDVRMKSYEKPFTSIKLDRTKWTYARIDGRTFSKFTKKMTKPFDENLHSCMVETTIELMKETNAFIGYTQSDEISLAWKPCEGTEQQLMFDGKIEKMSSVLASIATSKFFSEFIKYFTLNKLPSFDCRILELPSEVELNNMLLWRKQDAYRNSVQSAAHYHFGHKALMNKKTSEKVQMMMENGIDFYSVYPPEFRVGTLIEKTLVERSLTSEELAKFPSHTTPPESIKRHQFEKIYDMRVENKFRENA